jgi:hypothetical protein
MSSGTAPNHSSGGWVIPAALAILAPRLVV